MSAELPTSERIYRAVKAEILAGGFAFGERIEAVQLAKRHMSSITPIRAALHRLVGEGLVDARAGEGFQAPILTEVRLRDLYAWNAHIIQLGWQLWPQAPQSSEMAPPIIDPRPIHIPDIPTATAGLFTNVGQRSGNEHCTEAIDQLNDRLHLARLQEGRLFDDLDQELRRLAEPFSGGQPAEVRHVIAAYHRRRIRLAADLVDLMRRRVR